MPINRVPIPSDTAADALFASDSTCCICRERGKAVQLHHIDGDPSNSVPTNIAVLCLECHNQTQVTGGFGRSLTQTVVIRYRDEWLARVIQRRDAADRAAIDKMAGSGGVPPPEAPGAGSAGRFRAFLAFLDVLPDIRTGLRKRAQAGWDTGITATMVQATYDYIDALQGLLVTLSGAYSRGTFGEDPHRFFANIIASRFEWHRAHLEPKGPGSGGTIVNVQTGGRVFHDVEKMLEDMAGSLVVDESSFDWRGWKFRWRT